MSNLSSCIERLKLLVVDIENWEDMYRRFMIEFSSLRAHEKRGKIFVELEKLFHVMHEYDPEDAIERPNCGFLGKNDVIEAIKTTLLAIKGS